MEYLGDPPMLMLRQLYEFRIGSDFTDARSGGILYNEKNMEWKCFIFDSTTEDENNWIGDLFELCGRQLLNIVYCSTVYVHILSINTLYQRSME